MGIQSTQTISRDAALNRIMTVTLLILSRDYKGLEAITTETGYDLVEFININQLTITGNFNNWTDKMLEDLLDKPFYRHSMFDNYQIR